MSASRVVQRGNCEILAGVVDVSREAREQEFDEGKVLVGDVARQICEMSIRYWPLDPGSDGEAVKKRMKEIFPYADHFVGVDEEEYDL